MAEIKDKLVTAESLKNAYDTLNNKSYEKLDVVYDETNKTLIFQNTPELPENIYVDKTLTEAGNAADSKATGDAITEVKNGISELKVDIEELKTQLNNNGIQSDWNQNDETQLDYIKNRTHYETLVETDISDMHFEITVSGYGSSWQEYRHGLNIPFELGQTWIVSVFNSNYDEVYVCEDLLVKDENGELYIGTYQDRIDKPFCISKNVLKLNTSWLSSLGIKSSFVLLIRCVSGTAMLNKVYQIDNKYIDFQSQCMIRDLGKLINNYKFYKTRYDSEGRECILYTCNNIHVEMINVLDLYLHVLSYPSVVQVCDKNNRAIIASYIQFNNAIKKFDVIYGLSGEDCELMASTYGYTYKTNPTTTT